MTNFRPLYIFLAALAVITAYVVYDAKYNYVNWRTANRSSAGIAPSPLKEKEAVVQVYAARTYNWRGYFAVHPWIAVKKKNENFYTVYQVTAWNLYRGKSAVSIERDIPDRYWYGQTAAAFADIKGRRGTKGHSGNRKSGQGISVCRQLPVVAGTEQQHFRRLCSAGSSRTDG